MTRLGWDVMIVIVSKVSNFDFVRSSDVSRFECDSLVLTACPRDSMESYLRVCGSPRQHW